MSTTPTTDAPVQQKRTKFTTAKALTRKEHGEPITMLTAYDYAMALAVDRAEIDMILVGDSLAMVVLGYEDTLSVTMEDMLHHCKAVARGAEYALLIGDMPFMSYQVSVEEAVRNAGRFLQEAGMDAVKLEGGAERAAEVQAIIAAGIPVMGHIGLTPQAVNVLGGFRAQGKTADSAHKILDDALALEEAGCFGLVLEAIPRRLGKLISERLTVPTIGIGAGEGCDGQVLVTHDILGLFDRFTPRFAAKYTDLQGEMSRAVADFRRDVLDGEFPQQENTFSMPDEEWQGLLASLEH